MAIVNEANEKLKNLKNEECDEFVEKNITQIENASNKNDIASMYKFANNLAKIKTNKFKKPNQDENGNKSSNDKDIIDFFSKGFANSNKSLEDEPNYLNVHIPECKSMRIMIRNTMKQNNLMMNSIIYFKIPCLQ